MIKFMLKHVNKYEEMARKLSIVDKDTFLYNLKVIAEENKDANNLLNYLQSLQSEKCIMPRDLSFDVFPNELLFYYDFLTITLTFCTDMYKDICGESGSQVEEYKYLYEKYRDNYEKFIKNIEYIICNIGDYQDIKNKREESLKASISIKSIPDISNIKVPYIPIDLEDN